MNEFLGETGPEASSHIAEIDDLLYSSAQLYSWDLRDSRQLAARSRRVGNTSGPFQQLSVLTELRAIGNAGLFVRVPGPGSL